jgi:TRAP-type mannitol/chloroaromatic compound transport system permease large subunit
LTKEYPWYDIVNGKEDLMQGDFIKECPVVMPPSEISDELDVEIIKYDVVIIVLRKLIFCRCFLGLAAFWFCLVSSRSVGGREGSFCPFCGRA